jgi:CheY-like chemotaxis protein
MSDEARRRFVESLRRLEQVRERGRYNPAMPRVALIHWNPEEGRARAAEMRQAGFAVQFGPTTPAALKRLGAKPPDAFVVDLSRLPSHGREVALALRGQQRTRHVPVVFVAGEREKVARVRQVLPDAVYTSWPRIAAAVARAIARPPAASPVPGKLAGYSGTPLPQKLGIKPRMIVGLVGGPEDFDRTLGELPPGASLIRGPRQPADLVIWFTASRQALDSGVQRVPALMAPGGGLWVAWPKQASGVRTDLTQQYVRETLLANGLVDYKVCAIDETWSGLKFARRS